MKKRRSENNCCIFVLLAGLLLCLILHISILNSLSSMQKAEFCVEKGSGADIHLSRILAEYDCEKSTENGCLMFTVDNRSDSFLLMEICEQFSEVEKLHIAVYDHYSMIRFWNQSFAVILIVACIATLILFAIFLLSALKTLNRNLKLSLTERYLNEAVRANTDFLLVFLITSLGMIIIGILLVKFLAGISLFMPFTLENCSVKYDLRLCHMENDVWNKYFSQHWARDIRIAAQLYILAFVESVLYILTASKLFTRVNNFFYGFVNKNWTN